MNLDELGKFLSHIGIPAAFSFGLLLLIWQVVKVIGPYARDLCTRQTSLIETMEKTLKAQTATSDQQRALLAQIAEQTNDTRALRRVAGEAVVVAEKIAKRLQVNVDAELGAMRDELMRLDHGHLG